VESHVIERFGGAGVPSDKIAPGTSAYHLYVLQQPEWRPSYAHALDVAFIGAADRVEDALAN
jgi:hypothetical protein